MLIKHFALVLIKPKHRNLRGFAEQTTWVGKCAHMCLGGRCTWREGYAYVDMNQCKAKCTDTTAAHRLMIMIGSNRLLAIIAFKHHWAMSFIVLPLFSTH